MDEETEVVAGFGEDLDEGGILSHGCLGLGGRMGCEGEEEGEGREDKAHVGAGCKNRTTQERLEGSTMRRRVRLRRRGAPSCTRLDLCE